MDLEELYHVNYVQNYKTPVSKFANFDTELMAKAEQQSSQWMNLFKCSSIDEDVQNISRIIETTGLNAVPVNSIAQSLPNGDPTLKLETVAEKNNLIFLEKKFFKFESINDNKANEQITPKREESTDLGNFSTVFDETEPPSNIQSNESTTTPFHESSKKKHEKRKKGHKRNKPNEVNKETTATASTNISTKLLGAPPGAKATNSRSTRHNFDLTKNSNCSLQFRL